MKPTKMEFFRPSSCIYRAPLLLLLAVPLLVFTSLPIQAPAQALGEPDRDAPGDAMIQDYLRQETAKLEADFLGTVHTAADWNAIRPRLAQEFYDMLGLWPLPARTPLHATVTGKLARDGYRVEMVHYQSCPGLYVTGNLYLPAVVAGNSKLPAILYVCGHSPRPRDGNKTAYQSHGIWFARHGYVCLVLDTLEMGEIAGQHHGTYRESRWWWISRGYTPAGVEGWNGVRGIDYLVERPEVDPERIGVTGISGGGAATYWITCADERVKAAVPVSGLADLESYISNRVINGHCDCMFLHNAYQWHFTRIPALIAPRPLLFINSDHDSIFPMDANERIINRLERLYSLFGASDRVDSVVSMGDHAYRQDIRASAFRFFNIYFKNDPRPVNDSEVDLVTGAKPEQHPIPPEQLRVFRTDADLPKDEHNTRIDREFVPIAEVPVPAAATFDRTKSELLTKLHRLSFHHFPDQIPAASLDHNAGPDLMFLNTEPAIKIRLRNPAMPKAKPRRIVVLVASTEVNEPPPEWLEDHAKESDVVFVCEPRGMGASSWTRRNPPNYVERSLVLLGRTADSGRVWDLVATARFLRERFGKNGEILLAGDGASGLLAAYAALLEPEITGVIVHHPPASHMDDSAPVLLNVLRVCDIPSALGMLAPRSLSMLDSPPELVKQVKAFYTAAGAAEKLSN
jgi:dienelactone hydrolase